MVPSHVFRTLIALGVCLALLSCLACGSKPGRKLYPVRGKVLLDGKPAEGALVTLQATEASDPMEVYSRGQVKADGSFAMSTFKLEDGAPPGEYKAIIIWMPADARQRLMDGRPLVNKIPVLYADAKTSPLKVTVREGPNDWEPFELHATEKGRP